MPPGTWAPHTGGSLEGADQGHVRVASLRVPLDVQDAISIRD